MTVEIKLLRIDGYDDSIALPTYETLGAAGADIRANLIDSDRDDGIMLGPGERKLISTGLSMEIPQGYEVQVRPRSGLALKHGVSLINTPGTIDSDYRGPVGVILVNLGAQNFTVSHGMRVAQIVVAPVSQASFQTAQKLNETARGAGGFGSTGAS